MIKLAAVGDLHAGPDSMGQIRPGFAGIESHAHALLLAGDLTRSGQRDEAAVLASELAAVPIPVVAVLGNHDHHSDDPAGVRRELESAGVVVLEAGGSHELEFGGVTVGIVGAKGFGGGFAGASASEFGEPQMKAFASHARETADELATGLARCRTDVRVVLLHYAPVADTLLGEPTEIYPFLGSYLLAEACDRYGADLILHGHAHRGSEWGATPGGIRVRNVAQPVLRDGAVRRRFGSSLTPAGLEGRSQA